MHTHTVVHAPTPPSRILLVGGGPEVLSFAEPLLPGGAYQVEFVEAYEAPYAVIRAKRPDLVVLCLRIEDHEGFQLLSMLRLDPLTRLIPVVTYSTQYEGQRFAGVDEGDRFTLETVVNTGATLARH